MSTPPTSLCLLRVSAIGDVSHAVPVVRTIQTHWPETAITWIVGRTEHALVGDLDGVEFIVVDKGDGLFGAARSLARALDGRPGGREFDVLLHLQASWRANLLASAVRAPVRAGFDAPRARNAQGWFTNVRPDPGPQGHRVHVLDGFFQILAAAGLPHKEIVWQLPVPAEAEAFAARHAPQAPYLAVSPCTSVRARNFRNWSPERYARVADHAWRTHGLELLLTGGPSEQERAFARAIAKHTAAPTTDLVGVTGLKGLLAILRRAHAFVGPDSGPLHLANAVMSRGPVVGLYATSNPERTGPYCHRHAVANRYPEALRAELGKDVAEARWGQRVRRADAMERITVEEVIQRLDEGMRDGGKQ